MVMPLVALYSDFSLSAFRLNSPGWLLWSKRRVRICAIKCNQNLTDLGMEVRGNVLLLDLVMALNLSAPFWWEWAMRGSASSFAYRAALWSWSSHGLHSVLTGIDLHITFVVCAFSFLAVR